MSVRVGFFQAFHGHVGVDLRRGQAGVPQQRLDTAQISTAIEHVRREAMPQFVWAN